MFPFMSVDSQFIYKQFFFISLL